ncbi:Molecular chaperone IbpA, HSP20 family [Geosmithia morbida]|uniref:Molecular chaperone IbpA, HSP20 family n=1 Tax=Geosmithia morbida TaxID=1094350 RepID=A0A9P4YVC9_9HYPO|nr:Molecular chaperone IbpA, HSP20 family [Geosmithia morbida]KAF4122497.1 Molecular chaperone IbpA, HSP20 family [Geosmithia morbida]
MAFFPRTTYNDTSFTPLFRLLEDFDAYSKDTGAKNGRVENGRLSGLPTWQPKFDVRETADAYELHGELPGIARDNVSIEFTEPQSLFIRGRIERNYTSSSPQTGIEAGDAKGAITDGSHSPHQATVEDEEQSNAHESGAPSPTQVATSKKKQPAEKVKYWVSERSIGDFSRSFTFPTRVEQDGVTAALKDGVLSVIIPKAKKHEARRIAID